MSVRPGGIEYLVQALHPITEVPLNPGTSVLLGDRFKLKVSVKDSRAFLSSADAGVYAAYTDLLYDPDYLAVVPGTLIHSDIYPDISSGILATQVSLMKPEVSKMVWIKMLSHVDPVQWSYLPLK